jgi:hypothetical protein
MPGKDLPQFSNLDRYTDSLRREGTSAYGKTGGELEVPENDAVSLTGHRPEHANKPDKGSGSYNPSITLEPVSIATTSIDAPQNAQTWNSGDKGTNWMARGSYPTSKTGGPTPPKQAGR